MKTWPLTGARLAVSIPAGGGALAGFADGGDEPFGVAAEHAGAESAGRLGYQPRGFGALE